MDYPKFSSFEVQVTIGEGKSAVAGAEPALRGNSIARAPSTVWSRLVDHTVRREAGDTQDTPGGGGGGPLPFGLKVNFLSASTFF